MSVDSIDETVSSAKVSIGFSVSDILKLPTNKQKTNCPNNLSPSSTTIKSSTIYTDNKNLDSSIKVNLTINPSDKITIKSEESSSSLSSSSINGESNLNHVNPSISPNPVNHLPLYYYDNPYPRWLPSNDHLIYSTSIRKLIY